MHPGPHCEHQYLWWCWWIRRCKRQRRSLGLQCFSVLLELLGSCFVFFVILEPLQMRYPALCRCWRRFLARAWEASAQGPLQPPRQPDRRQPQGQCFTNCRMIVMTARARARARPRVMERTRAKTLSPRSAREKRFFPEQQQKSFIFCKYC